MTLKLPRLMHKQQFTVLLVICYFNNNKQGKRIQAKNQFQFTGFQETTKSWLVECHRVCIINESYAKVIQFLF
jgi:DNA modification methylase